MDGGANRAQVPRDRRTKGDDGEEKKKKKRRKPLLRLQMKVRNADPSDFPRGVGGGCCTVIFWLVPSHEVMFCFLNCSLASNGHRRSMCTCARCTASLLHQLVPRSHERAVPSRAVPGRPGRSCSLHDLLVGTDRRQLVRSRVICA